MKGKIGSEKFNPNSCILSLFFLYLYYFILYIKKTTPFSTLVGWTFLSKNTVNFKYK